MSQVQISINPLAEFLEATDKRKRRIILEQQNPGSVMSLYYKQAKASIKRAIFDNGRHEQIDIGIKRILEKAVKENWERHDRVNSVAALERWKKMPLPPAIVEHKLIPVSTKAKFLPLFGVNIKIVPTAIFRFEYNGKKYLGAAQVHIAKSKPFTNAKSALVAQMLNMFLSNFVAEEDETVHPRLCICIDPFAGTIINASHKIKYDMKQLRTICQEICTIWDSEDTLKKTGTA